MMINALPETDERVAVPLYTLSEAALIVGVRNSTLHDWAHPADGSPLITTVPARGYDPSVPFIGLTEAYVVAAAKAAGVPDHRIRPSVEGIKRKAGGLEHALASRLVWTDGTEIFLDNLDDHDLDMTRNDQRAFRAAVQDRLRLIEYDPSDQYARRLRLPSFRTAVVTIDPRVAGGDPLLRRGIGVRVRDLRDRVVAGDALADVARDFGISLEELEEVVGAA
jgi:uncharacterized protein (DUF433 family)